MKIYNNNIEKVMSIYRVDSVEKVSNKKTQMKDKIEISEEAIKLAQSSNEFEKIKNQKIENIKAMLNAGTYNVKAEDVADAILKGILLNKKI
ncbi:Anti-sigma-28 factor FlgM family protein [Thermoanaerobacter mathranii subsp. mathranii str. A3]|uniref:Negative regulator of flagellin synthesis FlgM n=2 Tax=Thermoanaerobacter TaxID=1754 RepID=A0ABT9M343_9THEO|nr:MULTISPECIES: flagellar biosynthesis anti-sigma factor FlgM [Thermoanaerobacter]ADH60314.1 Anti-sigma-28 factor FlgM family protein [Thermoanaerobacter mathranii subsp. mathranii str. A3]MDP9750549.1 negative regulator of flagellin synthesis FlgM [Thermoanaerobacter pentosaceus]